MVNPQLASLENPLVHITGWYALGVLLGAWLDLPAPFWMFAGLGAVVVGWFFIRGRTIALILALVSTGAASISGHLQPVSPIDIRYRVGDTTTLASIRGRLIDPPSVRVLERENKTRWRSIARIAVAEWRTNETWEPVTGEIVVSTPGILEGVLFHGERVEVSGVLGVPRAAMAPGLFDYGNLLRWQGVHYLLNVPSTNDWRRLDSPTTRPLTEAFVTWGRRVLALGLQEDEAVRLVWAMVLGWSTGLTAEVSAPFIRSGTLHIFAISGSHIALIVLFLVVAFSILRVPQHRCAVLVIPLIWFYTAATGWQPSAIRSTLMASIWLLSWALKRPGHLLNTLAGSGIILLLWDPGQLFQAGFQLSFGVVLGFALFLPFFSWIEAGGLWGDVLGGEKLPPWRIRLAEWVDVISLRRWRSGDIFLAPELRAEISSTPPLWFGHYLLPWSAMSSVATIVSLPLIVHYFHLLNPISLLSNLIVVPLSGAALTSGLLSLLTGAWWVGLAEVFNHTSWFIMSAMIWVSETAAEVRWGSWFAADWGWPLMGCYYMALAGLGFATLRRRWLAWIFPWAICTVYLLIQHASERATPRLTILPGAAAVMHSHHLGRKEDWLLDAGNEITATTLVQPYLQAQGLNSISAILLSHGDIQHIQGANLLSESFSIPEIGIPDVKFLSRVYQQTLAELDWTDPIWHYLSRGSVWGGWEVLHPQKGENQGRADDKSLVLRTTSQGWRVLVLPDLGRNGQRLLLDRESDLHADVLIGGIPEQDEPFIDELLKAVSPKLIVVASGNYPVHSQGSKRLRARLAQQAAPVWFTMETGAVVFRFSEQELQATRMTGTPLILSR